MNNKPEENKFCPDLTDGIIMYDANGDYLTDEDRRQSEEYEERLRRIKKLAETVKE